MKEGLSLEQEKPKQDLEKRESLRQYLHAVNALAKKIGRTFVVAGLGFVPVHADEISVSDDKKGAVQFTQEEIDSLNAESTALKAKVFKFADEKWEDYYRALAYKYGLADQFGEDVLVNKLGQSRRDKQALIFKEQVLSIQDRLEGKSTSKKEEATGGFSVRDIPTKFGSIRGGDIMNIIQATYPKNWIDEVASIEFDDKEEDKKDTFGRTWGTVARFEDGEEEQRGKITFYKSAEEQDIEYIFFSLGHEFGHANDWINGSEMTDDERAILLTRIAKRIKAKNRFQSFYVESINLMGEVKEKNIRLAKEYFAEIFAQALEDPSKLPIEDFQIVSDVVKKKDPHFDFLRNSVNRLGLILEVLRSKLQK